MTAEPHQLLIWAIAAAVLFAAGYLLVTFRRSRRAAAVGLAGVGLFGLVALGWLTSFDYVRVLEAAGLARGPNLRYPALCLYSVHMAAAHGLLVWAVIADRPPVGPDGSEA